MIFGSRKSWVLCNIRNNLGQFINFMNNFIHINTHVVSLHLKITISTLKVHSTVNPSLNTNINFLMDATILFLQLKSSYFHGLLLKNGVFLANSKYLNLNESCDNEQNCTKSGNTINRQKNYLAVLKKPQIKLYAAV